MAIKELTTTVPGYGPYISAGVPGAGTDEVQTLTIGGTPTGGTFKLSYGGMVTAAIPWNATNATLLASINSAIQALGTVGASGIVATAGTLTAGIGTVLLTFGANLTKSVVTLVGVADNSLTGTSPTLANVQTTPGVTAFGRVMALPGAEAIDTTNKIIYINTGTALAPTWTKVGLQS